MFPGSSGRRSVIDRPCKARRKLVFPEPGEALVLLGRVPPGVLPSQLSSPSSAPLDVTVAAGPTRPILTTAPHRSLAHDPDYQISKIISRETIPSYCGADIFVTDITTLYHTIRRGDINRPITIINAAAMHTPDPMSPLSRGLPLNHQDPQLDLLERCGKSIFIQRFQHNHITHTVINICVDDTTDTQLGPLLYAVTPMVKTAAIEHTTDTYFCCAAGRSRSVSLLMGFLAMYSDLPTPRDALTFVQRHRPQAQPNTGFMRQLSRFFTSLVADKEVLINTSEVYAAPARAILG